MVDDAVALHKECCTWWYYYTLRTPASVTLDYDTMIFSALSFFAKVNENLPLKSNDDDEVFLLLHASTTTSSSALVDVDVRCTSFVDTQQPSSK